jgi:hypothetical protein
MNKFNNLAKCHQMVLDCLYPRNKAPASEESVMLSAESQFIYTFSEEDLQMIARQYIHRELTPAELEDASHTFENDLDWSETAVHAIDLAVRDSP